MQDRTLGGSSARMPDLDWSQVRETVLMLELKAAQIEAAMGEGENSVEVLTQSFTAMAGSMAGLYASVDDLPDLPEVAEVKARLLGEAAAMQHCVQQSIVAFQFYDKLVQRLNHVCGGLDGLANLVSDRGRLYNPAEWVALQDAIHATYTTREERAMFDAVMQGMPVQQALETFREPPADSGGDVELF